MTLNVQVGSALRALPGERACGDAIAIHDKGATLFVAVIDGLGHGVGAARAADAAVEYLAAHYTEPLSNIIKGCDRALRSTRGVVMTLVRVDRASGEMTHAAIGNVEMKFCGSRDVHPVTTPGVVGTRLRKVVERRFQLSAGDVMAIFTDGISSRYDLRAIQHRGAQELADYLLANHAKEHDDAGCVVIRC